MRTISDSIRTRSVSIPRMAFYSGAICIFLLAGVPAASAIHHIGERWNGGIIFWFSNAAKTHGLVVDTIDLNPSAAGANWTNAVIYGHYPVANDPAWHLPTIVELHYLCQNASTVNTVSIQGGWDHLLSLTAYYWSSTVSGALARREHFGVCSSIPAVSKATLCRVRAVKSF